MVAKQDTEDPRPDLVEEAGETTAADSVPTPTDTRPVGEGTTAAVEGEAEAQRRRRQRAYKILLEAKGQLIVVPDDIVH